MRCHGAEGRRDIAEDFGTRKPHKNQFKPIKNQTGRQPDFFIHETDLWLIFPHELEGLTFEEIKENKPELKNLLAQIETKI